MELDQILTVVFAGVVAISTVVYAVLTWRLVSETKKMRRVQTDPLVSVHVEFNEQDGQGRMDLVIRNDGQGAAENISFEFEGDPTYFDDERPINELPVIRDGLRYLGPQQGFRIILGWLFGEQFTRATKEPWSFTLSYRSLSGDLTSDTYHIDFSQFVGLIIPGAPLPRIEKHLDTMQRDLHLVASGFSKLYVLTQTKEEARREEEEFLKQRRGDTIAAEANPKSSGNE